MKIIKKLLAAITSAIITVASAAIPSAAAVPTSQSEAKDGVVLVVSEDGRGSGFAVGAADQPIQYVVTNAHVVGNRTSATVFFNAAAGKSMMASVHALDRAHDIAILKLPETTTERKGLAILSYSECDTGDTVYTLGYPAYGDTGKDYNAFSLDDMTITQGIVSQKTRIYIENTSVGTDSILTDATLDEGNSGGPMVNSNGEVVAINTFGIVFVDDEGNEIPSPTNGGYAISTDYLISLLNGEGIAYETSSSSSAVSETTTTDTDTSNSEGNGNKILIIVLAAAAVIIVVVVVIVIATKKKSESVTPIPPAPRNGIILGVKGVMTGRSFPVNGSALMGRQPQCTIRIPDGTKGVSNIHCEIRKTAGGYEIVDRGSSCGTFLGNGQKLVPDVPVALEDGMYFYLGSPEQLFQIKF